MVKQETRLQAGTKIELTNPRTGRKSMCTVSVPIGLGGTAKIYAGTLDDGRAVVLKVQRWDHEPDPAFEREVLLCKEIHHRNVVHCVGVGVLEGGRLAIAFRRGYPSPVQLLAASDLKAPYRGPLPLDVAIDLSYELLNALEYLEKLGLVHHDVKLGNLLIEVAPRQRPLEPHEVLTRVVRRDYRAILIDLGAARTHGELDERPEEAQVPPQITPVCAPPEAVLETRDAQGRVRHIFHPSIDVYSAAIAIYRIFTGHAPYSHLQEPIDPADIGQVIGVKSAERAGTIQPIALSVIRDLPMDDTRFLAGDRSGFEQDLFAFLIKRLRPDPDARGDAASMKREFASLMRIKAQARSKPDTSRVFLPFTQGLVRVGVRRRHPLLRIARDAGVPYVQQPAAPKPSEPSTEEVWEPARRMRANRMPPPPLPPTKWRRETTRRIRPSAELAPPMTPVVPFEVQRTGESVQRDPLDRDPPSAKEAQAPHCLISPVLEVPYLLSKDRPCFIGRTSSSDVRIASDRVSRRHARILWQRGAYVLHDMGSVNGTLVNGFRVNAPVVLREGDRLSFGGFEFRLRVLDGDGEDLEGGTRAFDEPAQKTPDLSGVLGQLELMAVIELLEWKKHSGTLTISWTEQAPDRGYLYLVEGRIVNAEMRSARGMEAAVQLLSVEAGEFAFAHGRPTCPRRIHCSNDELWDAVRRAEA